MSARDYTTLSEEECLALVRQKDDEALDYLMRQYKPLVDKKSHSYFLIGGSKEDLIQEGMIGLFKAIRDYDASKNVAFYPFADLCITRQMITAVKTANRQKHLPLNTYVSLNKPAFNNETEKEEYIDYLPTKRVNNPEELMIDREAVYHIKQALTEKLSDLERKVLQLHIEGLSYVEVAKVLERPVKSIDNALQRIKKKVEQILVTKNKLAKKGK